MTSRALALIAALLGLAGLTRADDWPQFLGPSRDGHSQETDLRESWPKEGPPVVWQREVGEGFSGPVVVGERLILLHRPRNEEVIECLQTATGKSLWRHAYPTEYQDALGKGNGPRSTPVIADGRVITLGADGQLTCLELTTGRKLWGRSLRAEYRVPGSYFGVGTSPVVEQGLVLVNVGGPGAGIVAFAAETGKEAWRATSDGASYSSPVVCTVEGVRRAVFFTRQGVVILDPLTGRVTFQTRFRARYDASVNAATPLIIGDLAFFSASYETGALLLRLKKDGAEEVWRDEQVLSNHYNTCIYHDGCLYGFDGRQEAGTRFRCVELKTRKVLWEQSPERLANGSMILADGRLIVLNERGELLLVPASPRGYRELARAQVLQVPVRA